MDNIIFFRILSIVFLVASIQPSLIQAQHKNPLFGETKKSSPPPSPHYWDSKNFDLDQDDIFSDNSSTSFSEPSEDVSIVTVSHFITECLNFLDNQTKKIISGEKNNADTIKEIKSFATSNQSILYHLRNQEYSKLFFSKIFASLSEKIKSYSNESIYKPWYLKISQDMLQIFIEHGLNWNVSYCISHENPRLVRPFSDAASRGFGSIAFILIKKMNASDQLKSLKIIENYYRQQEALSEQRFIESLTN